MRETINFANESSHKCVIFSDNAHFFPSYIFLVFYTSFSPNTYQSLDRGARENLWMYTRPNLEKFFTLNLSDLRLKQGKCLLIIRPGELDEIRKKDLDVEVTKDIHNPSANEMIKLVPCLKKGLVL